MKLIKREFLLLFVVLISISCSNNEEKINKPLYPWKIIYKNATSEKEFEILPIEFVGGKQNLKSKNEEISFKYNDFKLHEILIINRANNETKIKHKFSSQFSSSDFINEVVKVETYFEKETEPRFTSEYIKYIDNHDVSNGLPFFKVLDKNKNVLKEYYNEVLGTILRFEYDSNRNLISKSEISFNNDNLLANKLTNVYPNLYNINPYSENDLDLFSNNLIDEIKISYTNGNSEYYKYEYISSNDSLFHLSEVKENGKTITLIEHK